LPGFLKPSFIKKLIKERLQHSFCIYRKTVFSGFFCCVGGIKHQPVEASFIEVAQVIEHMSLICFLTADMASNNQLLGLFDAVHGIVFLTPYLASKRRQTSCRQSLAKRVFSWQ